MERPTPIKANNNVYAPTERVSARRWSRIVHHLASIGSSTTVSEKVDSLRNPGQHRIIKRIEKHGTDGTIVIDGRSGGIVSPRAVEKLRPANHTD